MIGKRFRSLPFIFANDNYTLSSEGDSSVVAEHIRRIRTKIAAYTDRTYIETVWGCGYKWVR